MDEVTRHCAAMMEAMYGAHGAAADANWGAAGMMGMGGMGISGTLALGLLWLLVVAALAFLLIWGGIWLWRRGQPPIGTAAPSVRETLDRRYAAGELDRETYQQIRSDLETSS